MKASLFAMIVLFLSTTTATAQVKRSGFVGTAAVTTSSSTCNGDGCDGSEKGWGQYGRVGGFVSNNLAVVLEWSRFSADVGDGFTQRDVYATIGVNLYPSPTNNFFLSGGLGRGKSTADDGYDFAEITGMAYTVGVGIDLMPKQEIGFSITPFLKYYSTTGGKINVSGLTASGYNASLTQLGLGVTF